MNKKGLGKGLNALIRSNNDFEDRAGIVELNISDIVRNAKQPRQEFDQEKLEELAASIRQYGIIQPVIVRRLTNKKYELIAGERRWRAARLAGLDKIPAVIKEVSDREITELALIENIQREDLNPIEEALAYKQLMEEFGLTQEELSKRVGKSRSFIANSVRLLNLPPEAQQMVQTGQLSAGHARALLVIERAIDQANLAKKIVEKNLSVRQIEQLVKKITSEGKKKIPRKRRESESLIVKDIEEQMQGKLGTKVRIKHGSKRGMIEIEYYSDDDLQRIVDLILGHNYS
ncbi:ParB/RepB/Spo0J family partition protein [Thermincola potens]|uniref:ParB-like partition protein n=1 Tax=Thermincola potens (strain JR) TaxID=635013 RepID=D5XDU0_THEPJ|nr:ParB/RepB/Spo0J family partition protein [Thermincola potens]ADG83836.1 parB-like partition protein [Thermincola potens JR]